MGPSGGFGAGVEQDGADAVAEGGASGLAEGDDFVAFGFERCGEAAELGGFSGAVETFEGDEISALHRDESLSQERWMCIVREVRRCLQDLHGTLLDVAR